MAENTNTQNKEVRNPGALIIGASNDKNVTILHSGRIASEPFRKTTYSTIGINGKGEESSNVDIVKALNLDTDKLKFEGMKVLKEEVWLKEGHISFGYDENTKTFEKEYAFIYDNRIRQIVKAYEKKDGKFVHFNENDFIVKPAIKGDSIEERAKVIDNLLNFIINGLNGSDLKEKISNAVKLANGNLKAQGVDIKALKNLKDKLLFIREVYSKLDFNDPMIKSVYTEFKEDIDGGENMPTLKMLRSEDKDKYLKETFTLTGLKGITLNDFRKLTTTEEFLKENATLTEKEEFKEIQELKKKLGINTLILNTNTIYTGINENGEIAVYENMGLKTPSNGYIYSQKGLYEELKPLNNAIWNIKQAVYNPKNIDKEKVVNAENTIKEIVKNLLDKETNNFLKNKTSKLADEVDINNLYGENRFQELNKFQSLFNYAEKEIFLKKEYEVLSEIEYLIKSKKRIEHNPLAFIVPENSGLDKTLLNENEDAKDIERYMMFVNIPTLSAFGVKLFGKEKPVIGAVAYYNKEGELKQVKRGVNISNQKTMLDLGKMIDNVRNYDPKTSGKKVNEGLYKDILKYFYINKDEKSLRTSDNFKKSVELVKDDLSKLVELLKEKKFNEAKELVNSWDNSENQNLKIFASWSEKIGKEFTKFKTYNKIYYALSINKDKRAKNAINSFLKEPTSENLEKLLTTEAGKEYKKNLVKLLLDMAKTLNAVYLQTENYNTKLYEMNGGLDPEKVKNKELEKVANDLGYAVTTIGKIYYVKNGKVNISNTINKSFSFLDENLITDREEDFKDKKVKIYIPTDEFNNHLDETKKIKTDAENQAEKALKDIIQKANERLQYKKQEENIGGEFSVDIDDIDDDELFSKDDKNIQIEKEIEKEIEEENKFINSIEETDNDEIDIDEVAVDPNAVVLKEEQVVDISKASKMGL